MLKIFLPQIEIFAGKLSLNTKNILEQIKKAKAQKSDIIIFPEYAISGKFSASLQTNSDFLDDYNTYQKEIIAASNNIIVIFGGITKKLSSKKTTFSPALKSSIFVVTNGKIIHKSSTSFSSSTIIINNSVFNIGYFLGNAPLSLQKELSLDLCINISSIPYTQTNTNKIFKNLSILSKSLNSSLIATNYFGIQHDGKTIRIFDGQIKIFNPEGNLISLSEKYTPSYLLISLKNINNRPSIPFPTSNAIADIYKALQYGISTFLKTNNISKIVIGASGGIDSAVSAAMYATILSPQNIYLVNLPSKYNSKTTKNAATKLATALGCNYAVFPIQNSVTTTITELENTPFTFNKIKIPLHVSPLTSENIQARDRSSRILAGISACINGVFTCNANKTEMTIGYSTLYGDASGFLAALADLWKYQIYQLANYLNETIFKKEVIPYETINLTPSAELSENQNIDEGKGDPLVYPYHDYLLKSFVEHTPPLLPSDILEYYMNNCLEEKIGCQKGLISKIFSSPADFVDDLEKNWKLFTGLSIAKRMQSPPIISLTSKTFGADYQEVFIGEYFPKKYLTLKNQLLNK